MSDATAQAIIQHGPTIVTAIFAGIGALLGMRNHTRIQEIHLLINSRMDQLLAASKDTGRIEERAAQDLAQGRSEFPKT